MQLKGKNKIFLKKIILKNIQRVSFSIETKKKMEKGTNQKKLFNENNPLQIILQIEDLEPTTHSQRLYKTKSRCSF